MKTNKKMFSSNHKHYTTTTKSVMVRWVLCHFVFLLLLLFLKWDSQYPQSPLHLKPDEFTGVWDCYGLTWYAVTQVKGHSHGTVLTFQLPHKIPLTQTCCHVSTKTFPSTQLQYNLQAVAIATKMTGKWLDLLRSHSPYYKRCISSS